MEVDCFKDILVPVIGGLGIFVLGLEFMSNGIQNFAVSKMRALLAKIAGTPFKWVPLPAALVQRVSEYWATTIRSGN
jgi:phosphate:Na+ symporter